jgi:pimeloyl-ACP methyl ester carboxylesterase
LIVPAVISAGLDLFLDSQDIRPHARSVDEDKDVTSEEFSFEAGSERLAATRIVSSSGKPPGVVSFHGLGVAATRARIRYLLDHLAEHGVSSICFDFSGNGESSGEFASASLRIRAAESLAAAKLLAETEPRAIVGTSMGAHLAALVSPAIRPSSLVLFCPAAYPEQAADEKFDANFVKFNNRVVAPEALRASPALQALRSFTGNLLVVAAREDRVIPAGVIDLYLESAALARTKRVIWLDGCDHFVHPWLQQHPAERAAIQQAVQDTILNP